MGLMIQNPFSSASKLVICPKSQFQIIKHNLDTYKVERKRQFVVANLHHFAYLVKIKNKQQNKQKSTKHHHLNIIYATWQTQEEQLTAGSQALWMHFAC